jgi:hypothetical protein
MAMVRAMATNKLGRRLWWAMSEANRLALTAKLNPTSDVAPYRARLMAARPTLLGIPVASSLTFLSTWFTCNAIAFAGGTLQ